MNLDFHEVSFILYIYFSHGFILILMDIFVVVLASLQSYLLVVCSAVDAAVAVPVPNGADQLTIVASFLLYCVLGYAPGLASFLKRDALSTCSDLCSFLINRQI